MAIYNVGDEVRFHVPGHTATPRIGTIAEIVQDTNRGASDDLYVVEWRVRGFRRACNVRNSQMVLVNSTNTGGEPTPTPRFNPTNEVEITSNTGEISEPDTPGMEQSEQIFTRTRPRDFPSWSWMTSIPTEPSPAEIARQEAMANIEQYRWNGVLPIEFLSAGRILIPVYQIEEFHGTGGITSDHYRPNIRSTQLFRYKLTDDITIAPYYDSLHGTIGHYRMETGDYWTNSFCNTAVGNLNTQLIYRDVFQVNWARKNDVRAFTNGTQAPISKRPKKKLRRKYKEMPNVKEEKYYASKEFIA